MLFADAIADAVNPALTLLALGLLVIEARRAWKAALAYVAATACAVAGIYIVAAIDRQLALWARYGGDYSLHAAYAVAVGGSVALWRRQWSLVLALVIVAYLVLIIAMRYHSVADVVSSAAIALALTVPALLLGRRLRW